MVLPIIIMLSLLSQTVLSCSPGEFQCRDKTCITQNFRCDKFEDCKDGSDEIGCSTTGCQANEFRCGDGMCITNEFHCDHFEDCKDGSDELGCGVQERNCAESCKEPTLLYEDLQCRPQYQSNQCCPVKYDCSHIEDRTNQVEEKCHFHGRTYNIGETISKGEIHGTCYSDCECQKSSYQRLAINCNVIKCRESPGRSPKKSDCHLMYELGKCCSTGEVCGPFYSSCKVGSRTYYEGERFESSKEKCKYCVCKKSPLGILETICSKYQCVQEIRFHKEVMNFCAPSYLTMDDCCPINWICPQNDKIIISKLNRKSSMKCRFGNLQLNIGDKFKQIDQQTGGKVSCECRIPPYLTCVQDYKFPTWRI